uniref:Zinc finger CCCH domain-containing protein 18 n=1 Tax=Anthurium amnicola TaxID=1678845 RepID=A0A1D1Y1I1_9ARAE
MDFSEATKIVFSRIQKVEPELVSKIIGYLLLKDYGDREMIRLAFGPDSAIHSLISEAKTALPGLGLSPKPTVSTSVHGIPDIPLQFSSYSPAGSRPFSSSAAFHAPAHYWDAQVASEQHQSMSNADFAPYQDAVGQDFSQPQFGSVDELLEPLNPAGCNFANNYYYQEAALGTALTPRSNRRSPSLPDFPPKVCHYYYKGYCKHGTNCRYLHGQALQNGLTHFLNSNSNDLVNDDNMILPGSLEKLELELTELLKSRGGQPVSIAMLPMLYFEKFGKVLQAEGYLTESQRHGKAGFSLTKLLARLKNSIRILDRPHGQHSVMLLEDTLRHTEYRNDRNEQGSTVAVSQQIYLTFPAESTFTEEDVSNYFKQFGPVRDVRIPCQQKRMFGFVTFEKQETAQFILSQGNPHFVCGARVLVKPYKEKSRVGDRKYVDRFEPALYHPSYFEMDSELYSMSRFCNNSRFLRKQLLEEQDQALELQRMRLSEFHFAPNPLIQQPFYDYSMKELKVPGALGGLKDFPSTDHFSYQTDVLSNGSTSGDKARQSGNNTSCGDQESLGLCLPDSPFASTSVANSISTVI